MAPLNDDTSESIIRVSATSSPQSLGAAISHALYDGQVAVLRAIGAGAVNQAVKGCAIASGFVAQRALTLHVRPGFQTVTVGGQEVSSVVLRVYAN